MSTGLMSDQLGSKTSLQCMNTEFSHLQVKKDLPYGVAVKVRGNKIDKSLVPVKHLYYYPLLQMGKQRPQARQRRAQGGAAGPYSPSPAPVLLLAGSSASLGFTSPPGKSHLCPSRPGDTAKALGAVTGLTSLFLLSLSPSPFQT